MTQGNSETNTTSPKISGNERNKAALAYLTTFLIPFTPIGGAVGALICGLIYWRNLRTSEFVTNHSRKAAKINLVCTIAMALIMLLFFNSLDGPEALLPGVLMMPFILGGPFIGLVYIIEVYMQNKLRNKVNDATNDGSSLSRFTEKIDFAMLKGEPKDFYKAGIVFVEKGQFDDAIMEFVKVIKTASLEDDLYVSSQKELKSMGFSNKDIENVRQTKNA